MDNLARVLTFLDALNESRLPYMLVGSMSSNLWGIPRSTQDADFVVEWPPGNTIEQLAQRLGSTFRLDPQMSFETITMTTRWIFHLTDSLFKVEIFTLTDDPFDQSRFHRRIQVDWEGRRVWVSTAEDVIVQKLRFSQNGRRLKDLDDVRNVINSQNTKLDWPYIHQWCEQHQTRVLLEKLIESKR